MTARQKGYVSVRKAIEHYEKEGYLIDSIEKTGRFRKYKDLYSRWFEEQGYTAGFDLLAIHPSRRPILIQVTTTTPKVHKPFTVFAKEFGHTVSVEQFVRMKGRKDNLVIVYNTDGSKVKLKAL